MRILIIEDEPELSQSVSDGLRLDGYETDVVYDGQEALDRLFTETYDLVLLDLNLPKLDGMEVLREFRKENLETPVLILSARISVSDKISGLDEGANDYITKPFHFEELEARIRSLTRRRFRQESIVLKCGSLSFNTASRVASVDNEPLKLTRKETGILEYMLLHQGEVVSQEKLIEHVWNTGADEFSGSIRVHMSSLRKKLKEKLTFDPIHNKVGQGYVIGGSR